jgi:hypothetical protein
MRLLLKRILRKLPFYKGWRQNNLEKATIFEWKLMGRPAPPPHCIKQRAIREIAARYNTSILVETGTFYGDMIEALKGEFSHLYSVELSEELYKKAKDRFAADDHITLMQGDSGVVLGDILSRIQSPALFWLDGHYSEGVTAKGDKDTPVMEELDRILSSEEKGHVIIIDDARCFGTYPSYPSLDELIRFVRERKSDVSIEVVDDGIRILPN